MSDRGLKDLEEYLLKNRVSDTIRVERELRAQCDKLHRHLQEYIDQVVDELPPLAPGTTKCPLCPETYALTESVRRHLQEVHDKIVPAGNPSKGGKSSRHQEKSKVEKGMVEKAETARRLKEARMDQLRKAADDILAGKPIQY